jgi:protein CpxP
MGLLCASKSNQTVKTKTKTKNMKKLLIICGLLFSVVTFANAQQGGQGGQRRPQATPEERVKTLDEKVKLTDEQKTKATEVYTAAAADQKKMREEMMAGGGGDRDAMMAKMQKMTADLDVKINAFLTDSQKTAYKTWQDEMKAAREKMMKERQAGGNQ